MAPFPRRPSKPYPTGSRYSTPTAWTRLSADWGLTELRDASTDDLLGAVDAAASLAEREGIG